jgi:hypothetical protein
MVREPRSPDHARRSGDAVRPKRETVIDEADIAPPAWGSGRWSSTRTTSAIVGLPARRARRLSTGREHAFINVLLMYASPGWMGKADMGMGSIARGAGRLAARVLPRCAPPAVRTFRPSRWTNRSLTPRRESDYVGIARSFAASPLDPLHPRVAWRDDTARHTREGIGRVLPLRRGACSTGCSARTEGGGGDAHALALGAREPGPALFAFASVLARRDRSHSASRAPCATLLFAASRAPMVIPRAGGAIAARTERWSSS